MYEQCTGLIRSARPPIVERSVLVLQRRQSRSSRESAERMPRQPVIAGGRREFVVLSCTRRSRSKRGDRPHKTRLPCGGWCIIQVSQAAATSPCTTSRGPQREAAGTPRVVRAMVLALPENPPPREFAYESSTLKAPVVRLVGWAERGRIRGRSGVLTARHPSGRLGKSTESAEQQRVE
jgi:hypothetical protein